MINFHWDWKVWILQYSQYKTNSSDFCTIDHCDPDFKYSSMKNSPALQFFAQSFNVTFCQIMWCCITHADKYGKILNTFSAVLKLTRSSTFKSSKFFAIAVQNCQLNCNVPSKCLQSLIMSMFDWITNFTFWDQSQLKPDLMYSCKFANTHSIKTFEKENNQKGVLILLMIKENQRLPAPGYTNSNIISSEF